MRYASCQRGSTTSKWPLARALAIALILVFTKCSLALEPGGRVAVTYTPTSDLQQRCPKLRIAIINGVNFHFEIVSGLLHVLQPYEQHIDVFLSPWVRTANFHGAWDLVSWASNVGFKRTDIELEKVQPYDVVILVSPDYEVKASQDFVQRMQPRVTVAIVHNADHKELEQVVSIAPGMQLLSLSPHVAEALAHASGRRTDWLLPAYPIPPEVDCMTKPQDQILGGCLKGFALQGKFSNLRRNYSGLWHQMNSKIQDIQEPQVARVFHINVLGKGPDRLKIPDELRSLITIHRKLDYKDFYGVIAKNVALIPSLASSRYFTHKFSSTIITSLQTGTPVIADAKLLKSYTFLSRDVVYEQQEGEEELDAIMRIARQPGTTTLKIRKALATLRERLNELAFSKLDSYIKVACDSAPVQAKATGKGGRSKGGTA